MRAPGRRGCGPGAGAALSRGRRGVCHARRQAPARRSSRMQRHPDPHGPAVPGDSNADSRRFDEEGLRLLNCARGCAPRIPARRSIGRAKSSPCNRHPGSASRPGSARREASPAAVRDPLRRSGGALVGQHHSHARDDDPLPVAGTIDRWCDARAVARASHCLPGRARAPGRDLVTRAATARIPPPGTR